MGLVMSGDTTCHWCFVLWCVTVQAGPLVISRVVMIRLSVNLSFLGKNRGKCLVSDAFFNVVSCRAVVIHNYLQCCRYLNCRFARLWYAINRTRTDGVSNRNSKSSIVSMAEHENVVVLVEASSWIQVFSWARLLVWKVLKQRKVWSSCVLQRENSFTNKSEIQCLSRKVVWILMEVLFQDELRILYFFKYFFMQYAFGFKMKKSWCKNKLETNLLESRF